MGVGGRGGEKPVHTRPGAATPRPPLLRLSSKEGRLLRVDLDFERRERGLSSPRCINAYTTATASLREINRLTGPPPLKP